MSGIRQGSLYMTVSAFMLSIVNVLGKLSSEHLSLLLMIFARFSIALLLFLPFLWWRGSLKHLLDHPHYKLQILRCGLVLLSQYALFYYLNYSTLLNATVLQNLSPLLIPVLDGLIYKHKVKPLLWVWAGISFIGMICVLQPDKAFLGEIGVIGLLIPLGQAGSQVLYGRQAHLEKNEVSLFYLLFLSTLVSAGAYFFFFPFEITPPPQEGSGLVVVALVMGLAVATILNQLFRGLAYQQAKASHLAPLFYIALLFSGCFDFFFFHKIPNLLSIFGALLVLLGGVLSIYTVHIKPPAEM